MQSAFPDPTSDRYLQRIVAITRSALAGVPSRAFLFGSRAAGRAAPGSDYDIAIAADQDIGAALSRARTALEESTVPFTVDLIDLSTAEQPLRDIVAEEGIVLWIE